VWDRLRPRKPQEPNGPQQQGTPPLPPDGTTPDLEAVIARSAQGERLDLVGALLGATLVVPTRREVGPHFEGFDPVFYASGQVPVLVVFTSLDRARATTDLATVALTMTGSDLLLRMSSGYGLGVNPGSDRGFELSPSGVQAAAARARAAEPSGRAGAAEGGAR